MIDTPFDSDIGRLAMKTIEPDGAMGRQLQILRDKQEGYRIGITDTLASPAIKGLVDTLEEAKEALRLTREYVGEELLPPIRGWSWYEATLNIDAALAAYREQVADVTK